MEVLQKVHQNSVMFRAMELAGPQVELAGPQVELAGPQMELAGPQVELAGPQVNHFYFHRLHITR